MKAIPSHRAAHLEPYLRFLYRIGAPVERGLRTAGLPSMNAQRPDAFLPLFRSLDFLENMGRREGIDDLPLRALTGVKLADLSAATVSAILGSPTLKLALLHFCRLAPLEDPYVRSWVSTEHDTVQLHICALCSLDRYQIKNKDWADLLVLITVVKAFVGTHWAPQTIGFRSTQPVGQLAYETFPNTRFLHGQKSVFITFPNDLLSTPPVATMHLPTPSSVTIEAPQSIPCDFASSLKKIVTAYTGDGTPTIQLVAEIAGTSVRTLQRRLGQMDQSFSELLKQARYELSASLLSETNRKIVDIAYELGYSDPAHFSRAFKTLAGVTPSAYRRLRKLASI
ncbi:helix-turn-helix domain-containing protein [Gammaproteobacteria bacterium]|nr:helix-turn-helix domain-containing protein [Gammaproteobacteria bacterium]